MKASIKNANDCHPEDVLVFPLATSLFFFFFLAAPRCL